MCGRISKARWSYVYELSDPVNGNAYYVGCTDNPEARLQQHLKELKKIKAAGCARPERKNTWRKGKREWFCILATLGREPVMKVVRRVRTERSRYAESVHMRKLFEKGSPLTNTNAVGVYRKWYPEPFKAYEDLEVNRNAALLAGG